MFNFPVMLGFLNPHYQVSERLKLGEMMMKGFGNNTSHWKQSNEMEHKVWVEQEEKDGLGQYTREGTYLKIKMKASASSEDDAEDDENNPINRDNKVGLIELVAHNVVDGIKDSVSAIEIKPTSIVLMSYDHKEQTKESDLLQYNRVEISKANISIVSYEDILEDNIEPKKSEVIINPNEISFNGNVKINGTLI
jgi:hypothetical protein